MITSKDECDDNSLLSAYIDMYSQGQLRSVVGRGIGPGSGEYSEHFG